MKKWNKGVRITPPTYSDAVEEKLQQLKKNGVRLPSRHLLRTDEQLAGIRERERLEREKGMVGLKDRLRRFRELEVDELAASAEPTDDNSDCDDDIEDADYSEIDE